MCVFILLSFQTEEAPFASNSD